MLDLPFASLGETRSNSLICSILGVNGIVIALSDNYDPSYPVRNPQALFHSLKQASQQHTRLGLVDLFPS
jgi:hypothetical protein